MASYNRVVLRHTKLKQVMEESRKLLDRCIEGGVDQQEFMGVHIKLKHCAASFEKELFHHLSLVQDTNVDDMTQDQLQAEDILVEMETTWQINTKKNDLVNKSKLPELGLPTFTGDKLKYCEFWDRFQANVDRRDLPDSEKLSYLLSCLKGAALETVSGLTATNANYSVAVETLQQRYGSPDVLIDTHYTALNNIKKADYTSMSCRSVLDNVERNLRVLEKLGEPVDGNHLRALILSKFPEKVIHEHHLIGGDKKDIMSIRSNLDKIITAMEKSATLLPTMESSPPGPSTSAGTSTTEALQVRAVTRTQDTRRRQQDRRPERRKASDRPWEAPPMKRRKTIKASRSCLFCRDFRHSSANCTKFISVTERQKQVKGRCLHCLKLNHATASCIKRRPKCYRCQGAHLMMFCPKLKGKEFDNIGASLNSFCTNTNRHTYLQTAVAILENPQTKRSAQIRLILDCGSQRSYLSQDAAKKLCLSPLQEDQLLIYTFGASEPQIMSSPSTTVNIKTKPGVTRQLTVNIVPKITDRVSVATFEYPGVDIFADDDTVGETVELLIGNDFYSAILRDNKIEVSANLYLMDTEFGWVLSGTLASENETEVLSIVTYCQCHVPSCPYFSEPDLPLRNIDVKFLWTLESIGITDSPKATRQEEAVRHFNDTVQFQEGRYLVKWPWIQYPPDLPSNYGLAFGRLKGVLKRLDQNALKEYDGILKDQLELGIIETTDETSCKNVGHPLHYLPHHMVKQEGKKGRIVYDASAKTTGKKSLNECLYSGPSMLEDLVALLIKFRTRRFGIVADVEKAFLQVALQEDDRDVTRFLWLKDTDKEVSEDNLIHLRFRRLPFGVISSPFLLTATIRHYINQTNPTLLKCVADRCYVDNLVTGADTLQEAEQIYNQTKAIFEKLSINMRDWISNNKIFLDMIPDQYRSTKCTNVKVLGLMWNVEDDKLKLNLTGGHFETDPPVNTKRKVLRALARVYDPCGFVCPLLLSLKLVFQTICERKCKWDAELPADLILSVNNVLESLQSVTDIEVHRYIGTDTSDNNTKYHLHCFTDASKDAYAAVVYLKVVRQGQKTTVSFIMAKSHVSQTKDKGDLKIPKLELLGFLIGSRLLKYVRKNLELDISEQYLWSDSLVVLSWMRSNKLLPPFVANRVNEIKRDQPTTKMFYIHTKSNPADIATRPEMFQENKKLWFNGPQFLIKDDSQWPANRVYETHVNLLPSGEVLDDPGKETVDSEHPEPIEDEYSTDGLMELDDPGTSDQQLEKQSKLVTEIKDVQRQCFREELEGKKTHLARNLGLFTAADGILRCRGRMANTAWSFDKKYPILLPKNSDFTNNIIKHTHEINYHVGASHTLSIMREKYWIPQGRAQVMKTIRKCVQCTKHGGGPYRLPDPPALPPERVNYNRPFTYTGLDYLGPLYVSTTAGREKRWIALFTCLTVRAIHLEVVRNLSAEECLLAIRRFAAVRNKPCRIYSDNATCFKLVAEVVQSLYFVKNNIQWKFIPQLAPWHGGYYERLVGLVKHCLKRTLESNLLNDAKLSTVMKEVEAVLNSRLLTRVGSDIEHILRPVDFLSLGHCLPIIPRGTDVPAGSTNPKSDLIDSWKKGYRIIEEFKKMLSISI